MQGGCVWAKSKPGPEPSAPALAVGPLHKDRRAEQVSVPTPEYPAAVLELLAVGIQELAGSVAGTQGSVLPSIHALLLLGREGRVAR